MHHNLCSHCGMRWLMEASATDQTSCSAHMSHISPQGTA